MTENLSESKSVHKSLLNLSVGASDLGWCHIEVEACIVRVLK